MPYHQRLGKENGMDTTTMWVVGILIGACGGGFVILLTMFNRNNNSIQKDINKINISLEKRVTFEWLEHNIGAKIDKVVETLNTLKLEIEKLKKD